MKAEKERDIAQVSLCIPCHDLRCMRLSFSDIYVLVRQREHAACKMEIENLKMQLDESRCLLRAALV